MERVALSTLTAGSAGPVAAGSNIAITHDLDEMFQYVDATGASIAIEAAAKSNAFQRNLSMVRLRMGNYERSARR